MTNLNFDIPSHRRDFRRLAILSALELRRREQDGDEPAWMRYLDEPVRFITRVMKQHHEESWRGWRIVLKAANGKPLDADELTFFRQIAGGREPPTKRVSELWCVVGRRGGKDSTASVLAVEAARHVDGSMLRPGEDALIPCIANTKTQARVVWKFIKGYFETNPVLQSWLRSPKMAGGIISLKNRVEIMVTTNDFRVTRGFTIPVVIFDEVAFYRDENSANPDTELYNAIKPSMLTMRDAMMIGISSPHMEKGLLWQKYNDHYGKNDAEILVIKAPTRLMNPVIDLLKPGEIDKAYLEDPEKAAAEYGAEFRRDLVDYVSRQVIESLVEPGCRVREPRPEIEYQAYVDPSGGSRDSMTLAIGHRGTNRRAVLDLLHERRAPFMPSDVVAEQCEILRLYGVTKVTGDRYGGNSFVDRYAEHGVEYEPADLVKSDMYREVLPILNSGLAELLDWRDSPAATSNRFVNQVCRLERRTIRGGRDSIDHPRDEHDDVANAGLGVILKVMSRGADEALWTADQWAA